MSQIFARLSDVARITTMSESTIQGLVRSGEFPRPRLLSGRRVAWLLDDVQKWAEHRPQADLPPPGKKHD